MLPVADSWLVLLLFFPRPDWYCVVLPPPPLLPLPLLLPGELLRDLLEESSTFKPIAVSLKLPSVEQNAHEPAGNEIMAKLSNRNGTGGSY